MSQNVCQAPSSYRGFSAVRFALFPWLTTLPSSTPNTIQSLNIGFSLHEVYSKCRNQNHESIREIAIELARAPWGADLLRSSRRWRWLHLTGRRGTAPGNSSPNPVGPSIRVRLAPPPSPIAAPPGFVGRRVSCGSWRWAKVWALARTNLANFFAAFIGPLLYAGRDKIAPHNWLYGPSPD
jgi:hypothetical protein